MILHIDMDAFFASIEQAINPRLKGRPLIVGSRERRLHTVVCAASYEAKALGIDSGMPSKQAFQICPNLAFVPAQQGRYIWTSEQIFGLLKGYGFEVIYASVDEFQMDILDTPDPENLAQDIQNRIQKGFKITASIGVAKNSLLAKLGSKINKPRGVAILTQANLGRILAQVPANKLCGIGQVSSQILAGLGVITCLDLYQKTPGFMQQNFGKYGLSLCQALHSTEQFKTREIEEKPKSIGHSYTFPRDSANTPFLMAWIRLLAEMVARRLREQSLVSKTVHLWLNGPQIGNFGAQKTYKEPINDGYEIVQRCLKILAGIGPKTPNVRALGISCSGLLKDQYLPLFREQKNRQNLIKTIDRINSRHGEDTIYPAIITLTKRMQ